MKTTHYTINIKKNVSFRIVQLSDLHKKVFGPGNSELIKAATELKPDAFFITGDMVSRSVKNFDTLKPLITELNKTAPVYYSLGNHETDMENVNLKLYKELIAFIKENCIMLDNATAVIRKNDVDIRVSGLTIYQECYKNNGSYRNLRGLSHEEIHNLLGEKPDPDAVNILLAHNPNFLDSYAEYGSDLVLSGHVHGGCVRLPFIGGVLSPERKFFPKYSLGKYTEKNTTMIVTSGLGKFRLFNPPEIVVIDLIK